MAIIITYDIPSRHTDLKQELFKLGYAERIINNGRFIFLPNTTVYHSTKTAQQGKEDVQRVCIRLNIQLERCISTQFGPDWDAIWGEPFDI